MSDKLRFRIIIAVLALTGIGIAIYKNIRYDFPFTPGLERNVWTVEAKVTFNGTGDPVTVSLAVPDNQRYLTLLEENYASTGYDFGNTDEDETQQLHRRVIWSKSSAEGKQVLYYRASVAETSANVNLKASPDELSLPPANWTADQEAAAGKLLGELKVPAESAEEYIEALLRLINDPAYEQDVTLLIGSKPTGLTKMKLAQQLLFSKQITVHLARGFELQEGHSGRLTLDNYLGLYDSKAQQWRIISVADPDHEVDVNFLVWQRGGLSLSEVTGADNPKVTFTAMVDAQKAYQLAKNIAVGKGGWLFDFSIYALPIEQQATFRMLFLVPIGALIVVIMRSLVGLKTSGTFMPILIAMAFVSTRLVPGLVLFVVIVSAGLLIRSYLSSLNLLLVPRISAVLVVVLILMAAMSIISYKLGFQQGLRATLFPMIILSWTVERLSIIWEEDGPREVFEQTGGSLVVAVITYVVMSSAIVSHVMFSFPELLLTLLAIIMMLGQYTGYRLSELIRFKSFTQEEG